LLERHACPVPFHEIRTRFLGNIASPIMNASPIKVVEGLWGGKLPEFDSLETANELIGALVMGLWNGLARHQERNAPFRLTRKAIAPTRQGLAALALMRRQELDGFIEGLFGQNDVVDVPERAHRAFDSLGETRAFFATVVEVTEDETKSGMFSDVETMLRRLHEMTKIAEHEIHAVVLSCTRAPADASRDCRSKNRRFTERRAGFSPA
jgi:hypothetical protein